MKSLKVEAVQAREKLLARKTREDLQLVRNEEREKQNKRKQQKQQIKNLTFDMGDDEEEEDDDGDDDGDDIDTDVKDEKELTIKTDPDAAEEEPVASTSVSLLEKYQELLSLFVSSFHFRLLLLQSMRIRPTGRQRSDSARTPTSTRVFSQTWTGTRRRTD